MGRLKGLLKRKELWAVVGLLLILLFNLFFSPNFFKLSINNGHLYGSMIDVLNRGASLVIVSIGMCLVIATRGIDISVGSVNALGAMVAAYLLTIGTPVVAAIAAGLLVGCLCGVWNGFLVAKLNIQPMIATLILMTVGRGYFLGLPFPTILMGGIILGVYLLTRKTSLGLSIESVGINEQSARYAGINTRQVLWICYIICGVLAALSGMMDSANVSSADGNNNGLMLELDAILAVVLGGTSMDGGKFYLGGTVIGALFIQTLSTTIFTFGIPSETIMVVKAIVVIFVVLLSSERMKEWSETMKQKRKAGVSVEN